MKKLGVTLLALCVLAAGSLWAADNYKNGQDLTGTWRIRVTIPPGSSACPSGPNPCVFLAIATVIGDGTVVQTAALPATSTGHGVWTRSGLRAFNLRTTYFRLDASGFPVGTAETVAQVEITPDGLRANGSYVNTLFDLNGNPIGGFTAAVAAVRMVP